MMEGKKRLKATCKTAGCNRVFSYLPRADVEVQRNKCYKCVPKKVSK